MPQESQVTNVTVGKIVKSCQNRRPAASTPGCMASWLDRMESEWIEEPVFNIHQYIIYYTSSIPCKSSVTLQNQVLPAAPQAGDPQFHL